MIKVLYCPASLLECWNNLGTMSHESIKGGYKDRNKTLPSLCGISLNESGRQYRFAAEVFSEKRGKYMHDNQASEFTCKGPVFIQHESEEGASRSGT